MRILQFDWPMFRRSHNVRRKVRTGLTFRRMENRQNFSHKKAPGKTAHVSLPLSVTIVSKIVQWRTGFTWMYSRPAGCGFVTVSFSRLHFYYASNWLGMYCISQLGKLVLRALFHFV